jgi:hypothetical protein
MILAKVNGVLRRVDALWAVMHQHNADHEKYGKVMFRYKLLREVTAAEVTRYFPTYSERLKKYLTHALKRSTRAFLTRHPNLRKGEHIRRCRELWAALEAFSPKLAVAV